jgi:hypothetical protein
VSEEKTLSTLTKATDRARFLKRASITAFAVATGSLLKPGRAFAGYPYKCCDLCQPPSSSCSGCAVTWCWTCCWNGDCQTGARTACCECYQQPVTCTTACSYTYTYDYSCEQCNQPSP